MRHFGKLVEAINSKNHLFYKEESKIERKINAPFLSFHKESYDGFMPTVRQEDVGVLQQNLTLDDDRRHFKTWPYCLNHLNDMFRVLNSIVPFNLCEEDTKLSFGKKLNHKKFTSRVFDQVNLLL